MRRPSALATSNYLLAGCIAAIVLSGCGGDAGTGNTASVPSAVLASSSAALVDAGTAGRAPGSAERPADTAGEASGLASSVMGASQALNVPMLAVPVGSTVTTLQVVDRAGVAQGRVPLTFGQVFAKGDLPAGVGLVGAYNGASLPLQVNVKASHADGSVRHAVISTILPQVAAGQTAALVLNAAAAPGAVVAPTPGAVLGSFDATVKLNVGGKLYSASTTPLFRAGAYQSWLAGPVTNEWLLSAPLTNADNVPHPHLAALFAVRHYSGGRIRVDVTVENNWAYEPDPKNLSYDAQILVNGQAVYTNPGMSHYHHARWRKMFWVGEEPKIHLKHDSRYLIASKAVPNYDQSVTITPAALTAMKASWDKAQTGPMGMALLQPAMATTGGRPDIGIHHAWAVMYLLSMDERAKEVTLGLSNLSGSWPMHYRDRATGQPVSIQQYPYVRTTKVSSDSYNPVTKKYEDLPTCHRVTPLACDKLLKRNCVVTATDPCTVQYMPDTSHHPSLAYLPYLVTGDAYHLDELMFWANWNLLVQNPAYRKHALGLVSSEQVRGQAWALRSLGQAAYIAPDKHPMKSYFNTIVNNNLDLYHSKFVVANPNQLGFNDSGYAVVYGWGTNSSIGVAPWMDDFFTAAVGHLLELDFPKAAPLLAWKSKFPVGRMTAPGYCWIDGATYQLAVRPTSTAPYYTSFADAYRATIVSKTGTELVNSTGKRYLDQPCNSQAQADWRTQYDRDQNQWRSPWVIGEMTGYATSDDGYPSNMQPALAYAAGSGIPNAAAAWTLFINRKVKPNYGNSPHFAIVPR